MKNVIDEANQIISDYINTNKDPNKIENQVKEKCKNSKKIKIILTILFLITLGISFLF